MRLDFELITVAAPLQAAKFDFLFRALQVKNYSSSVRYISSIQSMICICQAVMQQYIFLCKWRGIRNPQDFQLNIVWLFIYTITVTLKRISIQSTTAQKPQL